MGQHKLSGRVIDAKSKRGLEGVTIYVFGKNIQTSSDIKGEFTLTSGADAAIKQWKIRLTSVGYIAKEVDLSSQDFYESHGYCSDSNESIRCPVYVGVWVCNSRSIIGR